MKEGTRHIVQLKVRSCELCGELSTENFFVAGRGFTVAHHEFYAAKCSSGDIISGRVDSKTSSVNTPVGNSNTSVFLEVHVVF